MSRLEIILLILLAFVLLKLLSNGIYIEGLEGKNKTSDKSEESDESKADEGVKQPAKGTENKSKVFQKNGDTPFHPKYEFPDDLSKRAPDEYLDRDSRQNVNGDSLMNSQYLKTMTPFSLSQREVDADHEFRWIADKWPKCKERCSHRAIHRQIKCFRRNGKRYSDDIPIDKLFTIPAFEKDKLGHTVCDTARSGININVKPQESTFCSLLNDCSPSNHALIKKPKPIALEQVQQYDRQSIGFSVQEMQKLTEEERRVLNIAFPEKRTVQTIDGPKGTIPEDETYRYSTVGDIKMHVAALSPDEKSTLTKALKAIRIRTQSEKTFDVGSIIFSTLGISI